MVGLTANRSIQDEKLIEAIFQSHHSPETKVAAIPVYGATATNLIIDARPTTNAVANTAKGAGTENMDHYKDAKKAYLGIDNIHVVRDSLAKVVDCLYQADVLSKAAGEPSVDGSVTPFVDRQALRRSGWLKLLSAILEGTLLITRNVHVNSSHVLIHCSDGWDRTAQLSALSQLCLDPYYRTIKGFQVLVEKDWVSFGHRFMDRCGHLSSDKFFVASSENGNGGGSGTEVAQALFASMQNRFASQGHLKEMSPVFHQFLECVRQIQRQFPTRFEFNERFLRQLHTHLYSCQFGNFLYNCERERRQPDDSGRPPWQRTSSIWNYFNSPSEFELNINPDYDKALDDPANRSSKADMGVLFVNTKNIRFWNELYGRTDEEMNGRVQNGSSLNVESLSSSNVELVMPIESGSEDPVLDAGDAASVSASDVGEQAVSSTTASSFVDANDRPPSSQGTLRQRSEPIGHDPLSTSSASQWAPVRANAQDLFGSGVKSVWGRLSSNASAAFTAVQGAYDGVARDFKTISVAGETSGSSAEGGGELRNRESLSEWGTAGHETTASPATVGTSNVWASSRIAARLPSSFSMDNPWNTERPVASSSSRAPLSDAMWADHENTLPHDPTIVDPASLSHTNPSHTATVSEANPWSAGTMRGQASSRPQATASEEPRPGGSDPLGIGPL
jgi:myotubularin-related protein 6/7/8